MAKSFGNAHADQPAASAIFPASSRLKRREEFSLVFEHGQVAVDDVLVIHAVRVADSELRLGLSISKKVGNSPQRNRWKRLIRESFRLSRHQLPTHMWLIVRPRRGALPELKPIQNSLHRLAHKLHRRLAQAPELPVRTDRN